MEAFVSMLIACLAGASTYWCAGTEPEEGRAHRIGARDLAGACCAALGAAALSLAERVDAGMARWIASKSLALVYGEALAVNAQRATGFLLGSSALACAVGAVLSGSLVGALLAAALPISLLVAAGARKSRARRELVAKSMPEAFGALGISLGSGYSLARAMRYVGAHSEEPVKSEFMRVGFSIECGTPAALALDDLLRRLPAPGLDMVSMALRISQRTGAPPGGLLADAARYVGDRVALRRMLDVKTAQARMSARMVAAMPVVMMAFLLAFSTDYRQGAASLTGACCMAFALGLDAIAWLFIKKVMEVEI